jgi:hypothetical protein
LGAGEAEEVLEVFLWVDLELEEGFEVLFGLADEGEETLLDLGFVIRCLNYYVLENYFGKLAQTFQPQFRVRCQMQIVLIVGV